MADEEFNGEEEQKYDPSEPSNDTTTPAKRERSRSPIGDRKRTERRTSRSDRRDRDRDRERRRSRERSRSDVAPRVMDPKKVYISNVPYELSWQKVKDLVRDNVGETIRHVEMFESSDNKSRGAGVLEFADRESADNCMEKLNKYEVNGRNIIVRELRESDIRRHQRQGDKSSKPHSILTTNLGPGSRDRERSRERDRGPLSGMGGGSSGGVSMSIMQAQQAGISPHVLQQLGIEGPLTNQVFVANLDYKVNWKKLKDIFKMAGNVVRADIKEDRDGKSRGFGTVSFDTPLEAVQAVSMFNGQTLFDRPMTVKMDKLVNIESPRSNLPAGLRSIGMGLGIGGQPIQNTAPMGNSLGVGGMSSMSGGGMSSMGGMNNMTSGMGGNFGNQGMGMMGNANSGLAGMGGGMGGMPSNMGMNSNQMGGMGGGMNDIGINTLSGGYGSTGMSNSGGLGDFGMNRGGGGMSDMGMSNSLGGGSMSGMMGSSPMMNSYTTSSSRMDDMRRSSDSRRGGSGRDGRDMGGITGRPGQEGTIIFIKNLPYAVSWKDLKEHFRNVGDVKYAEIMMESGKSRGMGTVRFATNEQAQRAVDLMHGQRIEGREIVVRIDN